MGPEMATYLRIDGFPGSGMGVRSCQEPGTIKSMVSSGQQTH